MEELFREQWWLFLGIGISFLCSVICQLLIAYYMMQIVKESEKLESEKTKYFREWIEEYIKEEGKIANSSVFVDKKIQQISIGKFNMVQMKHFSGQALLLMIFLAGVGACLGIIRGKTLGQVLPFYIISLLGLYVHFSLSALVNLEENKKIIRMNIVDFLENKEPYFYCRTEEKEEKCIESVKEVFGEAEELELKEILREILA